MPLKRRDLFRFGGLGGAAGLIGGLMLPAQRLLGARNADKPAVTPGEVDCVSDAGKGSTGVGYVAQFAPPPYLPAGSRDALHTPPAWSPRSEEIREVDLSVVETTLEVAGGQNMRVWAYGGSVPGPIVRATVGQRLRVSLANHSGTPHSVHFHGAHDVQQDGLSRVAGTAALSYEIEAGPVGLHPYHCHVPPYSWHLGKGMYGTMIVDPPKPRPAAHEFVLCLCGFDVDGDGRNELYAWNGVAGYYERFPLKVPADERMRSGRARPC